MEESESEIADLKKDNERLQKKLERTQKELEDEKKKGTSYFLLKMIQSFARPSS